VSGDVYGAGDCPVESELQNPRLFRWSPGSPQILITEKLRIVSRLRGDKNLILFRSRQAF
jgi:hypothetical protein